MAAIVVDRRSSAWQLGLLHMGLLTVAVLVSGNFLHRFAHIQTDQRQHFIDINAAAATKPSRSDAGDTATAAKVDHGQTEPVAATEDHRKKSYEGIAFHKSYGFGYWLGEFTLTLTNYFMNSAVGYAMLYLVADDELPSRQYVDELIKEDRRFRVVAVCDDGRSAVAEAEKLALDALFLDIRMPGMDGFEVVNAKYGSSKAGVTMSTFESTTSRISSESRSTTFVVV